VWVFFIFIFQYIFWIGLLGFAVVFDEMTGREGIESQSGGGDLFREESKRFYDLDTLSTMEKVGVNVENLPFSVLFVG